MTIYSIETTIKGNYKLILEKTKKELAVEGFGILTEINVRKTLKKKLGVDYQNYTILGACQPQSAYQMLQKTQDVGLLLPCNVIVYENADSTVVVSAIKPTLAVKMIVKKSAKSLAENIERKLKKVIKRL